MPLRRSMLRPNSATARPAIGHAECAGIDGEAHRRPADAELLDQRRQDRLRGEEIDERQEGDQRDDAEAGAVGRDHAERRSARTVRCWSWTCLRGWSTFPAAIGRERLAMLGRVGARRGLTSCGRRHCRRQDVGGVEHGRRSCRCSSTNAPARRTRRSTSPALCSIGTLQVLLYSVIEPSTTRMFAGRASCECHGTTPPGCTTSLRRRSMVPFQASPLEAEVDRREHLVGHAFRHGLARLPCAFSATWSAGHSPAKAGASRERRCRRAGRAPGRRRAGCGRRSVSKTFAFLLCRPRHGRRAGHGGDWARAASEEKCQVILISIA